VADWVILHARRRRWGDIVDLTVIDETGTRTEQVSVPDAVAAGRIATRLVQVMGLPQAGPDGQPIAYGFRHDASGRQIDDGETLAQAQVGENDVLRLVALSPAQGYSSTAEPGKPQPRSPAPPVRQAPTGPQPAETAVLSPAPPLPSLQATPPTRSWQPFIAIAAAALVLALVGVAVAIIISHGGRHETRLVAQETVTEATSPTGTATTTEEETPESTSGETGATTSTGEGALPAVSTQQMASEIQGMLRDWHEDVVQGNYHAAWELLSARKQTQAEGEGGYATWAKNQATLRPYLNPAGLQVSVEDPEAESGVARVDVTGMTWDKPGAHCSEWSGITWVKRESGEWRYDPGYSTTQQREQEWKSRYTELLGGSC
jgi:hypothetical protein